MHSSAETHPGRAPLCAGLPHDTIHWCLEGKFKPTPSEILPRESGHCNKQITQIKLPQPAVLSVATASSDKADSTWRCSQAVPHPSTNQALGSLTSEVRRDPVYSTRYGRQRESLQELTRLRLRLFGQTVLSMPSLMARHRLGDHAWDWHPALRCHLSRSV